MVRVVWNLGGEDVGVGVAVGVSVCMGDAIFFGLG